MEIFNFSAGCKRKSSAVVRENIHYPSPIVKGNIHLQSPVVKENIHFPSPILNENIHNFKFLKLLTQLYHTSHKSFIFILCRSKKNNLIKIKTYI